MPCVMSVVYVAYVISVVLCMLFFVYAVYVLSVVYIVYVIYCTLYRYFVCCVCDGFSVVISACTFCAYSRLQSVPELQSRAKKFSRPCGCGFSVQPRVTSRRYKTRCAAVKLGKIYIYKPRGEELKQRRRHCL